MAHDEGPVGILRATSLILTSGAATTEATTIGRVIVSGAKLWFDTGSAWETVTSA